MTWKIYKKPKKVVGRTREPIFFPLVNNVNLDDEPFFHIHQM
jgi:hypothetical protein